MQGDNGYEASTIAMEIKGNFLSADQVSKFEARLKELKDAALATTFSGTADEISEKVGMFHFMKGKIDTFEELLQDHLEANTLVQIARQDSPAQQ